MWRVPLATVILVILALFCTICMTGCGQKEKRVDTPPVVKTPAKTPEVEIIEDAKPKQKTVKISRIKSVVLVPATPRTDTGIKAKIEISPALAVDEGESLSYSFYKNAQLLVEHEENFLPPKSCQKNDYLYADVTLFKDGEEIDRKRSEMIQVLNSSPAIGEIEFPEMRGPGTYHIKVYAADADEDTLTFSLDEEYGIPVGMTIDSSGGIINYTTPQEIDTEKEIKFKVVVKDTDGAEDWRELKISFSKTVVKEKAEKNE